MNSPSDPDVFQIDTTLTQRAHGLMPYAGFIGLKMGFDEQEQPLFCLPFAEQNIGNIFLPALHGGLIGGFLESASALFLHHVNNMNELPKMVDFSLDYLRSGKPQTSFARCILTRQGSRITNVAAEMWQADMHKPIAVARVHFKMPQEAA
ncbi:PaaI family thioesterase [Snodgrassella sp. CFCC 13594]|uniref:PaaI family thioesterase n=1 Tax=Snodgrassella sp. CFCC 13594 TaxID=1775559 RepID=UPI000832C377|nr:PaaI family thioesterase [Snodgrassella sp. CFCC 13594]